MGNVWLPGVVRNGQVVFEAPLDLLDGTAVIVTNCYEMEDDPRRPEPKLKLTDEEFAELTLFLQRKKDSALWPEFEARLKEKYGEWLPEQSRRAA